MTLSQMLTVLSLPDKQTWQIDLAALSTNSLHKIVEGADHASFWLDAGTAKVSIAAILQVVEAARTGQLLALE
jgi:hypothetical protein